MSLDPVTAELATLRALRVVASEFAATWAELLWSMPDNYDCHMTCTEANAAADLYRALGRDIDADAIVKAHMEHDEDHEREAHEDEPEGLEDAAAQDEDEADDPFMKAERCGSRPYPAGSEGDDGTECVRPKGHPGDHSDEPIPFDEPTATAPETGAAR
jgi:hypothetical protein